MADEKKPECEMCGNKKRYLAYSSKHYKDDMVDGWRMGEPMLVCWKCESE
jgi:hypothetical protein